MNNIIKQYIDKITINNINDFTLKNNIILNKNELNVIYNIIKNKHEDILKGNTDQVRKCLKNNLTQKNYDKVINLFDVYYQKYHNYF